MRKKIIVFMAAAAAAAAAACVSVSADTTASGTEVVGIAPGQEAGETERGTEVITIRSETDAPSKAETKAAETKAAETKTAETKAAETSAAETSAAETEAAETKAAETEAAESGDEKQGIETVMVSVSSDMKFAGNSAICSGSAKLYKNHSGRNGDITVCVNAGHGTPGGERHKTLSHPDGSPKVTGGSNANGAVYSYSISSGMEFGDGTEERAVTLREALMVRDRLLDAGYSVLMIREDNESALDNIARTVLANNYADCHMAIHWDSSTSDKGAFFMSVPKVDSYLKMEPVASTWQKSEAFGDCLVAGLRSQGVKIFGDGRLDTDLTQTSYSSVPSVDIELGDKGSDISDAQLSRLADGLVEGVNAYFGR